MAISNTTKAKLNKMNRAAADAQLGTIIQNLSAGFVPTAGSVVVGNTEISASKVTIVGASAIHGYLVDVFRSGSFISASGIYTEVSGSKLYVIPKTTGSWTPVAGDYVNYITF